MYLDENNEEEKILDFEYQKIYEKYDNNSNINEIKENKLNEDNDIN